MFRQFVTTILAAFATASPLLASDEEHSKAVGSALTNQDVYASIESRSALTSALERYWSHFASRVPRLSPDTQEWLSSELVQSDSNRATRALNSPEYSTDFLVTRSEYCLGSLSELGTAIDRQLETEMFYWSQVALCLDDGDLIVHHLAVTGLSNGKFDGPFYLAAIGVWHDVVLEKFLPSAMADTMGWSLSAE